MYSGDEVHFHLESPEEIVHPFEERDLGQGNNLRGVGGGGNSIPGRRHFDKVSGKCGILACRNIVSPYRGGSHRGTQGLRSLPYDIGA